MSHPLQRKIWLQTSGTYLLVFFDSYCCAPSLVCPRIHTLINLYLLLNCVSSRSVIMMTNSGYIKRLPIEEFEAQSRGGKVRSTVILLGDALQCDAELYIDSAFPIDNFSFLFYTDFSNFVYKYVSRIRARRVPGCPQMMTQCHTFFHATTMTRSFSQRTSTSSHPHPYPHPHSNSQLFEAQLAWAPPLILDYILHIPSINLPLCNHFNLNHCRALHCSEVLHTALKRIKSLLAAALLKAFPCPRCCPLAVKSR